MNIWPVLPWPKSKKARSMLALFVFSALILTALFFIKKPPSRIQAIDNAVQNTANAGIATQDSDEDGLKDWEEIIFKTDPTKKDTDGDGTGDKEEIASGRDPLKPGPDDFLPKETTTDKTPSYEENLTRGFTETFLFDPITKITTGQRPEINPLSVEAYAEELLKKPVLSTAPKIKAHQVVASIDDSIMAIQNYFEVFGKILSELNLRGEHEIILAVSILETQKYDELNKLDKHVEYYERAIRDMQQMRVPPSLISFHVERINYLLQFKLSTELMRNMEADPLRALLAIKERIDLGEELKSFLTKQQGIIVKNIQDKAK